MVRKNQSNGAPAVTVHAGAWNKLLATLVIIASGGNGYVTHSATDDIKAIRAEIDGVTAQVRDVVQGESLLNWRVSQLEKRHDGNGT